jgi:hypothetical protein
MKLIAEVMETVEPVLEESDGKKNLYLTGIFMQADVKNKNGRIYPGTVMANEVARYVKEQVNTHKAIGELNHPSGPSVNLDRACHLIESLKIDGSNVIGRAKVLNTPMGGVVRGLIEGGACLGVSSRGLGSLNPTKDGIMEVQNDFRLITVDCVSDPSAPAAFVQGVMENVEYFYGEDGSIQARTANSIKTIVKKQSIREIEESKARLFEFYLRQL